MWSLELEVEDLLVKGHNQKREFLSHLLNLHQHRRFVGPHLVHVLVLWNHKNNPQNLQNLLRNESLDDRFPLDNIFCLMFCLHSSLLFQLFLFDFLIQLRHVHTCLGITQTSLLFLFFCHWFLFTLVLSISTVITGLRNNWFGVTFIKQSFSSIMCLCFFFLFFLVIFVLFLILFFFMFSVIAIDESFDGGETKLWFPSSFFIVISFPFDEIFGVS